MIAGSRKSIVRAVAVGACAILGLANCNMLLGTETAESVRSEAGADADDEGDGSVPADGDLPFDA